MRWNSGGDALGTSLACDCLRCAQVTFHRVHVFVCLLPATWRRRFPGPRVARSNLALLCVGGCAAAFVPAYGQESAERQGPALYKPTETDGVEGSHRDGIHSGSSQEREGPRKRPEAVLG